MVSRIYSQKFTFHLFHLRSQSSTLWMMEKTIMFLKSKTTIVSFRANTQLFFLLLYFYYFLKGLIYLRERDRQREFVGRGGKGRREGERISSIIPTEHGAPCTRLDLMTMRSWAELKSRVRCNQLSQPTEPAHIFYFIKKNGVLDSSGFGSQNT